MKRKLIFSGMLGILCLAVFGWSLLAKSQEQKQEVNFDREYSVGGVKLKPGTYILIHRNEAEKTGEACTFFYRAPYNKGKQEAAKMHCTITQGVRTDRFVMGSTTQPDGTNVVKSFQFAGSTEVHNLGNGS